MTVDDGKKSLSSECKLAVHRSLGTATFTVKHTDEEKYRYSLSRGIDPVQHCCLDMAFHIAHPIETPHQGRNRIVDWIASQRRTFSLEMLLDHKNKI